LLLADLGAQVIKIEPPPLGDSTRQIGPPFLQENQSAYYIGINRNKKSVVLDLKKTEERDIFIRLVQKADVVYDNFRPGTLEKLNLHYEELKKHNPAIISCSITAFGETGPYRDFPAFDLVIQAMSGVMSFTGEAERPPVRMGIPLGDLAGGMMAAFAIGSALYARQKTAKGCQIHISLLDCQLSLLTYVAQYYLVSGILPKPIGSAHQSVVPYQAFKTKDIYIVVAVFVEKYWERFCQALGLTELISDARFNSNLNRSQNRAELIPILETKFLERTGEEWLKIFFDIGVPAAPINTLDKILTAPHVLQNKMVIETEHPQYGKVKSVGNPVKIAGMEEKKDSPAPLLGEHTTEVFKEYLEGFK
jgi:crotonobetainyl-CoA:carnitine CoA-transferase CaiB-like acyl-CoA transferase